MKQLIGAFAIFLILSSASLFAQEKALNGDMKEHNKAIMKDSCRTMKGCCSSDSSMKDSCNSEQMKMDHDKTSHMDMKNHDHMKMRGDKTDGKSIVREGTIDLKAIDKNNDGKVYQDMMDWNVISDIPGDCPICGMKLKEATLEQAKENLIKRDFKVK
jgi:uncharacterized protein involved in copper resistance